MSNLFIFLTHDPGHMTWLLSVKHAVFPQAETNKQTNYTSQYFSNSGGGVGWGGVGKPWN